MTNGNLNNFDPNDPNDINLIQTITQIIKDSIKKTNLDLTGLTVLTEAATGHWIFTPFIAAMSNASSVVCITKNSRYGQIDEITQNFSKLIQYFGFNNTIKVFDSLNDELIKKADLITNSGHVRPINKQFLKSVKNSAVISLMWEPWEYRESDLDLSYCIKNGICVLGVNEDNDILNIMKYVENLIIKIFQLNKFKLKNKKIILVAENKSAFYMIKPLKSLTKSFYCVSQTIPNELKKWGANIIGSDLSDPSIEPYLQNSDLIIINSAPIKSNKIGKNGLNSLKLKKLSPKVKLLIFFGNVDYDEINNSDIECLPDSAPSQEHMEWNLDILDARPTVELCVLGLKAVESLAKDRKSGLGIDQSMKRALESPFCLDFSKEQKIKYFKKYS